MEKLIVWGSSVGGPIAEMLAATNGRREFEDLTKENAQTSSDVHGRIAWY